MSDIISGKRFTKCFIKHPNYDTNTLTLVDRRGTEYKIDMDHLLKILQKGHYAKLVKRVHSWLKPL